MKIRLPHTRNTFPRPEAKDSSANAWGSQWKYLPRASLMIVRNAMRDGLRIRRG